MVLGEVVCEFAGGSGSGGGAGAAGGAAGGGTYAAGTWPTGWCHPPSATCTTLGVKDNMCGECKAFGNGGFSLSESKM
eukprot:2796867-Rhodomonas_salina.1